MGICRVGIGLMILALCLCRPVYGVEFARLPEELAISEAITLEERGSLEITEQAGYFRFPDEKQGSLTTQLDYGLTDRQEIDLDVPVMFAKPAGEGWRAGPGDLEIGFRYGVIDYRTHPLALDVGLGFSVPTGSNSRDLGKGRWTVAPSLTVSRWIGSINAQVNLEWRHALGSNGNDSANDFEYNLALVYPTRRGFMVLEGNGESNEEKLFYITPEMIWQPSEHTSLLLATPIGVTHNAGGVNFVAKVSVEIEGLSGAD